jgi:hypothetical protein
MWLGYEKLLALEKNNLQLVMAGAMYCYCSVSQEASVLNLYVLALQDYVLALQDYVLHCEVIKKWK